MGTAAAVITAVTGLVSVLGGLFVRHRRKRKRCEPKPHMDDKR